MTIWLWVGFIMMVLGFLALDLGVFNRKAHVISTGEALRWTVVWVVMALIFNAGIYYMYEHHWLGIGLDIGHPLGGWDAAVQFLTGYILEKSLSLDNIFVIALIFTYFRVPNIHQHRVLFWGILGALILRGVMIGAGAALIERFHWVIYIFGALLIFTAVKMLRAGDEEVDPERNLFVRIARRLYPVTEGFRGQHFFVVETGRRLMTPLFLVLLVVESTDVLFAVDSIPAIFGVTKDPFLVFTSNVFAILGLRSLYFALAGMMDKFRYLKISLVFVLAFIGSKMLVAEVLEISPVASLGIVGAILTVGIGASMSASRREEKHAGAFASTDASMLDDDPDGEKAPGPHAPPAREQKSHATP